MLTAANTVLGIWPYAYTSLGQCRIEQIEPVGVNVAARHPLLSHQNTAQRLVHQVVGPTLHDTVDGVGVNVVPAFLVERRRGDRLGTGLSRSCTIAFWVGKDVVACSRLL